MTSHEYSFQDNISDLIGKEQFPHISSYPPSNPIVLAIKPPEAGTELVEALHSPTGTSLRISRYRTDQTATSILNGTAKEPKDEAPIFTPVENIEPVIVRRLTFSSLLPDKPPAHLEKIIEAINRERLSQLRKYRVYIACCRILVENRGINATPKTIAQEAGYIQDPSNRRQVDYATKRIQNQKRHHEKNAPIALNILGSVNT